MKYKVSQQIPIFGSEVLSDLVQKEGEKKPTKVPTTLGKMLTTVCVGAQAKNYDDKYRLFKIAARIHDAEVKDGEVDLSPEDVVLLKRFMGEGPYPAIATGATIELLEGKKEDADTA